MFEDLSDFSIAELVDLHSQLHADMYEAGLPSAQSDRRSVIKADHYAVLEEFIRRGVYHPVVSPMDREAVEDLETPMLHDYFLNLSKMADGSSFPDSFQTTSLFVGDILIRKYSPDQPRDDFGRWVPLGQAGIGGAGASPQDDDKDTKVRVWNKEAERVQVLSNDLFSKELRASQYSNLMGNPAGATVTVRPLTGKRGLRVTVEHKTIREHVADFFKGNGGTTMHQTLKIRINAPEKLVAQKVRTQVETAKGLGVKRFTANASRDYDRDHDYRNLARAGYNGKVPAAVRSKLPPEYKDADTIGDLVMMDGGYEQWFKHGVGFTGEFDPTPNSLSYRLLRQFLAS